MVLAMNWCFEDFESRLASRGRESSFAGWYYIETREMTGENRILALGQ